MSIPERRVRERVAVSFGATGTAQPKGSCDPLALTIPAGTEVLIQKQVQPLRHFSKYVTQSEIRVRRTLKDTPSAMLILYRGYKLWVARKWVQWR